MYLQYAKRLGLLICLLQKKEVKLGQVDRTMNVYCTFLSIIHDKLSIINMCITVEKIVNLPLLYYKQPGLHI
jgi:hypothetical protein